MLKPLAVTEGRTILMIFETRISSKVVKSTVTNYRFHAFGSFKDKGTMIKKVLKPNGCVFTTHNGLLTKCSVRRNIPRKCIKLH